MKQRFRMYQRGGTGRYYIEDNITGKQENLGTSDRTEALRLLHARNEDAYQPALNTQIASPICRYCEPTVNGSTCGTDSTRF